MRALFRVLGRLGAVALAGCALADVAWNAGNRGELARDIDELFRRHGVAVARPACAMIGTTRDGTCTFPASADQVARLVAGLALAEVTPGGESEGARRLRLWELARGCRRSPGFGVPAQVRVDASERRAGQL